MTALSPKWTKSIRTAALRTRTSRRITLALHRSNSAVRRRRWLRHYTADAGPLRYPVNGLLSGHNTPYPSPPMIPSSRTPDGDEYRCNSCGNAFVLASSPAGDVCCPYCNALCWIQKAARPPNSVRRRSRTTKQIRFRTRDDHEDSEKKLNQIREYLNSGFEVEVSVLRSSKRTEDEVIASNTMKTIVRSAEAEGFQVVRAPLSEGRRVSCRLSPTPLPAADCDG